MKKILAPSILSANFINLHRDLEMINDSQADWIHIDVMDGIFVPNISFGFSIVEAIRKYTNKPIDLHLMIQDPDRYIETFKNCGVDNLSVHYETCNHLHRTLYLIKKLGMKAGVVLNPHTPVHVLQSIIHDLDLLILMSVNPGFSGQKFINHTYHKIEEVKNLIKEKKSNTLIEIDGGINLSNSSMLFKNGVNILVVGSAIFSSKNPKQIIKKIKNNL